MFRRILISSLFFLLFFGTNSGIAQQRTIAVVGHAEEKGSTEARRTIQINVSSHETSAALAFAKLGNDLRAIKKALETAGADKKEIKEGSVSMSANYDYSKPGVPPSISGYQLVQPLTVRAENDQMLPKLIDAATSAGASSVSFANGDEEPGSDEGLQKAALEDAHTRALQLAKASGVTLGDVLSVSAIDEGAGGPMSEMEREEKQHKQGAGPEIRKLELRVVYEVR